MVCWPFSTPVSDGFLRQKGKTPEDGSPSNPLGWSRWAAIDSTTTWISEGASRILHIKILSPKIFGWHLTLTLCSATHSCWTCKVAHFQSEIVIIHNKAKNAKRPKTARRQTMRHPYPQCRMEKTQIDSSTIQPTSLMKIARGKHHFLPTYITIVLIYNPIFHFLSISFSP